MNKDFRIINLLAIISSRLEDADFRLVVVDCIPWAEGVLAWIEISGATTASASAFTFLSTSFSDKTEIASRFCTLWWRW